MINIAIIGTGSIASSHVNGYKILKKNSTITGLADIYPENAKKIAEEHQLNVKIVEDYRELLRDPDIHAVSICTPPFTHSEIAIACLKAGKHVLVEKPMASSLKECDEMIKAAEENNKILSVVAQNRFLTPIMRLKHVLEQKLVGKIAHAQVDSFWWRGHSYYDLWWRGTWEKEGGGCTLNHAVHHIDMLQWMMGQPKSVTAVTTNTLHDNAEVEDLSIAILSYENGSLAQVTSSVVHHGEEQQLIFQGEKGRVSVPWKVRAEAGRENGFPLEKKNTDLEKTIHEVYENYPALEFEGHTGQINDFLTAIENGENVLVDGVQGRQTLEIIMAVYESASTGRTIQLPITESNLFYDRAGVLENAIHFYEKTKTVKGFEDNEITTGGQY
ncbi:Gfo/Idh/MocA family protein [Jeotgalibacillus proteolyticus]|uniref:Gfo/Idh/MocA family protein n=1 Tax=Jeotgalibacillus proteolyticus TaxID=2082395 RepID=UPI003CE67465